MTKKGNASFTKHPLNIINKLSAEQNYATSRGNKYFLERKLYFLSTLIICNSSSALRAPKTVLSTLPLASRTSMVG